MDDTLPMIIRDARDEDLLLMEWGGEYTRFRNLYRLAYHEAQEGNRVLLVAEADGELVGQIFIHLASRWRHHFSPQKSAYLHSFRVKPKFRNQGFGSSLLSVAEKRIIQHRYQRAIISVAQDNPAALRLYQNQGYVQFGNDPGVWSFYDHEGRLHTISEPSFLLTKVL
jgi:ribosomal protein S18 acetylase RimI-like enzyme